MAHDKTEADGDTMDYFVEILYKVDPRSYIICNADSHYEAVTRTRQIVGYNPQVPVRVTETPINKNCLKYFHGGLQ